MRPLHDPLRGHPEHSEETLADQELRRALERLEWSVRSQVDIGRIVLDNSVLLLGGAFTLGLLIGLRR